MTQNKFMTQKMKVNHNKNRDANYSRLPGKYKNYSRSFCSNKVFQGDSNYKSQNNSQNNSHINSQIGSDICSKKDSNNGSHKVSSKDLNKGSRKVSNTITNKCSDKVLSKNLNKGSNKTLSEDTKISSKKSSINSLNECSNIGSGSKKISNKDSNKDSNKTSNKDSNNASNKTSNKKKKQKQTNNQDKSANSKKTAGQNNSYNSCNSGNPRKITILGTTGSIGTQALEVIEKLDNWEIAGLSCYHNVETLAAQAKDSRPPKLAVADSAAASSLKEQLPADYQPEILTGSSGYEELAALPDVDVVLNSIVGAAGLKPSLAAARLGKRLALANKESLVIGGGILMPLLRDTGGEIIPVDSEHNAIYQLLENRRQQEVENLILTASGGPFRGFSSEELEDVTLEDALDHPNWDMGSKITIDSATLMNKGLEVIEAHWLFGFSYDKIKVVVHPQSIIHSLIEMIDGSFLAELGQPDMKIPIQHALTHPEREDAVKEKLNLTAIPELTFQEPDTESFPALKLAYQAGRQGQGYPVVLNAANEIAVSAFLEKKIAFLEISYIIEEMLARHQPVDLKESDDILALDQETRRKTREFIADL